MRYSLTNRSTVDGSFPKKPAIFGLGGVGKTQIALEFVYQLRERKPDCAVFWIPVTNIESMLEAYLEVGRQLQIPNIEQEQAGIQKLVQQRLSQESSGKWLLVFDNSDDIDIWTDRADNTTGSGRRIDYLPQSKYGSILFTTRSRKAAAKLAGKNVVSIGEMDDTMAKHLLEKCLINRHLLIDEQTTMDLLEKLTHLPLAIVQAAAYINENQIALSDYTALLDDTEQNLIEILSEEFEDEGRYQDIKIPIATTGLISFGQIRSRDPLAAEYLSFKSCVDAKDIPQSLLPPAQSNKKAIDAIRTLSAHSFITKHKTDPLVDIHRLVHLAKRNWLRTKCSLRQWTAKALKRLEEVFPDDNHRNRRVWRMYLPHARYAALESEGDDDVGNDKTELLWKFGHRTYKYGRYNEAEKAYAEVMETRKRVLGEEHPSTLTSMANLASTFRSQGRWKEAEELGKQVVENRKRVLGAEHPDTLTSMTELAFTYNNQGRWNKAEELGKQVMETQKRVLGAEHSDTLDSMFILSWIYRDQGRWKEAEELGRQVVESNKRVLREEHPTTLVSMGNLALTYKYQCRWDQAEELFMQIKERYMRLYGVEHPDTLTSMGNLAATYRPQGRLKEAQELEVEVMETSKKLLGKDNPDTLRSMANLAATYRGQGRLKEAEEMFLQVIEVCNRLFGEEHPNTLSTVGNLALTYMSQGRWKEAEELHVQVMETRKRALGEEHPDTLASMDNLAHTLKGRGQNAEAINLMEKCVQLRTLVLGADQPYTLSSSAALIKWQTES
jgi:tetratricopeptide (TPR) repeat protein